MSNSLNLAKQYLGKEMEVVIDRPLGSKHPKWDWNYPVNYGYVPNTKSADGKELDVFFLGVDIPIKKMKGKCIAVIHRLNDIEDKIVVVPPDSKELSNEEIEEQILFQEKWFKHKLIR